MKQARDVWISISIVSAIFIAIICVAVFYPINNVGSSSTSALALAYETVQDASMVSQYAKVDDSLFAFSKAPLVGGSKKALLIGINYRDSANELLGCIEDVSNLTAILERQGFAVEQLTDDTVEIPSLGVMQRKLHMFLATMKKGDTGFLWFSGHGTLLQTGENAWVPIDYASAGLLSETWFLQKLQWLPSECRLFIGSDACHSGSMLNLKYDVEPLGVTLETRRGNFKATDVQVLATQGMQKSVSIQDPSFLQYQDSYALYDVFPQAQPLRADVVVLSACMDSQSAADAFLAGESQGAMTYAFCKAYQDLGSQLSLAVLQDHMRQTLRASGYKQVPQLSIGSQIHPKSTLAGWGL